MIRMSRGKDLAPVFAVDSELSIASCYSRGTYTGNFMEKLYVANSGTTHFQVAPLRTGSDRTITRTASDSERTVS